MWSQLHLVRFFVMIHYTFSHREKVFCVTHVSGAGRFWNGDISKLILENSHIKGQEHLWFSVFVFVCLFLFLLLAESLSIYRFFLKFEVNLICGSFLFIMLNSCYSPSIHPRTEGQTSFDNYDFFWFFFCSCRTRTRNCFPSGKKEDSKLLKCSWNPDPTHTCTRTHRKVKRHSVLLS